MSILVKKFDEDIPPFYDLIQDKETINETPEQVKNRIFDRINKHNGGDDL